MKHDLPQIITRGYGWRPRARDPFWSGSLIFEFSPWNYSEVCLWISKRVINSPTHHLSVPHEHEEFTTLDVTITFTMPSCFCFMSRNHLIYKDCDGEVMAKYPRSSFVSLSLAFRSKFYILHQIINPNLSLFLVSSSSIAPFGFMLIWSSSSWRRKSCVYSSIRW